VLREGAGPQSRMTPAICDVSIVLVSWNTRDLLLACLASLRAAAAPFTFEAIVVDNASSDGTPAAIAAAFPDVTLIANETNRGFAAANNQGICRARGRNILLLNSDTVPEPGAIATLVAVAGRYPRAGAVGGMLRHTDGSFQASFQDAPGLVRECISASGLGHRLLSDGYPGYPERQSLVQRQVEVISGACMLLPRAAVEQVGLLDESYFMYSEETDYCRRLRDSGWEVWYTPEARVLHHGGQSTKQVRSDMVRALYRSKVRYIALHDGRARALVLRMLLTAILGVKWLLARVGQVQVPYVGWRDLAWGSDDHARSLRL
jgi:N-acetylglucosaminyl-diphospho-decaprenol L-rhamnosyltransferase